LLSAGAPGTLGFEQGVLELRIPRPEERKPHRVRIGLAEKAPAVEGSAESKS
jgi:hypothetical protein